MEQATEYLQHPPKWESPMDLLPLDELEQRLDLVEKFQAWKRTQLVEIADSDDDQAKAQATEWKLNRLAYTACMIMPLSQLVDLCKGNMLSVLDAGLKAVVETTRSLLFAAEDQMSNRGNPKKRPGTQQRRTKEAVKRRTGSAANTGSAVFGTDDTAEESNNSAQDRCYIMFVRQNEQQKQMALGFDEGRCRISGSNRPHVAYFIPFSFNSNTENCDRTRQFSNSLVLLDASLKIVSMTSDLGGTAYSWNMISLDHTLHSFWDKACFGIKYLGTDNTNQETAEIKLQFVWMPMAKKAGFLCQDSIDLSDERDKTSGFMYNLKSQVDIAPCHKVHEGPGWPIVSGDTFIVRRPANLASKFVEVVKLRWYLGQIAAISGAAGDPDFINGHDDDWEGRLRYVVRIWRQMDREPEKREAEERLEYERKKATGTGSSPRRQQ